jgi:hypothetical protein
MRRFGAAVGFVLALGAAPVQAQGGLNLSWDGCTLDEAHHQHKTFSCDTNTGPDFQLFASVVVPVDVPRLVACELMVDVWMFGRSELPPWWLTAVGQCRANAVRISFDPTVLQTNCSDLWAGVPTVSLFQVVPNGDRPYMTRIKGAAAISAGQEVHVPADGAELNVCRITLSRTKTTGAGSCPGCQACALISFEQCLLKQPPDLLNIWVTNPYGEWWADWNGNCTPPDPVHNRSWGAIKGMYR